MDITDIQQLTKEYSIPYNQLQEYLSQMREDIESVRKKYLGLIKTTSVEIAEKVDILQNAILSNSHLFEKPRTQVFSGMKVGLQLKKESYKVPDEERTIKLIEKHFEDEKEFFIDTKKSVKKSALKELSDDELEKIKVIKSEPEDQVVIKSADDIVNKMIDAIIKSTGADDIKVDTKAA